MATLGELSAGVAHEIRSPLSAIAVTAELLARTETPCPTNQGSVAGHAVRIKEGVAHIAKIVADLQSSPEDTTRDPMSRKGDATLFAQEHQFGHATAGWGKRVASPFINIVPYWDVAEILANDPPEVALQAFRKGYGLSEKDFAEIVRQSYQFLLLRSCDKYRWAIDRSPNHAAEYGKTVRKTFDLVFRQL